MELFLSVPQSTEYWEYNFSADGCWNTYRFSDYRQDMVAESKIESIPIAVKTEPVHHTCLTACIDISTLPVLQSAPVILASTTAVIQTRRGQYFYFANKHTKSEADFHCREGFCLEITHEI